MSFDLHASLARWLSMRDGHRGRMQRVKLRMKETDELIPLVEHDLARFSDGAQVFH